MFDPMGSKYMNVPGQQAYAPNNALGGFQRNPVMGAPIPALGSAAAAPGNAMAMLPNAQTLGAGITGGMPSALSSWQPQQQAMQDWRSQRPQFDRGQGWQQQFPQYQQQMMDWRQQRPGFAMPGQMPQWNGDWRAMAAQYRQNG